MTPSLAFVYFLTITIFYKMIVSRWSYVFPMCLTFWRGEGTQELKVITLISYTLVVPTSLTSHSGFHLLNLTNMGWTGHLKETHAYYNKKAAPEQWRHMSNHSDYNAEHGTHVLENTWTYGKFSLMSCPLSFPAAVSLPWVAQDPT
jgi:hypothetical protein